MRNKRLLTLALALCLLLPLAACALKPAAPWPAVTNLRPGGQQVRGSGDVVEQKTPLPERLDGYALRVSILSISLRDSDRLEEKLVIDESLDREVVLIVDSNIAEHIKVSYDAATGQIVVDTDRRVLITPTKLRIAVGAPVKDLEIDGAWDFTYNCPSVTDCRARINGAANGTFTFGDLNALWLDINGTGEIKLAGTAKRADLTINGGANIRAFDLSAQTANVNINGLGNCQITATQTLNAQINGLGEITYAGEPKVNKQVNGLGQVKKK